MATISLSNRLKIYTLIWLTTDSSGDARGGFSAAYSLMNIHVAMYSGTPPTGFGDLDDSNSVPSGTAMLWHFVVGQSTGYWSTPGVNNGGAEATATFTSNFAAAIASGTASWFRMWTSQQTTPTGSEGMTANKRGQLIGTIGTGGSGADLILPATNIVSGKSYKIDGLKLQLATDYTY
jgi:hypothetical protein